MSERAIEARPSAAAGATAWRHHHLLDVDTLSRDEIELVLDTAAEMRGILERSVPRAPALRGVAVVTLFYEASTRTRVSFELAAKTLGADVVNVSATGSSIEKGESLVDTVRTIERLGARVIVMRHASAGAPYLAARNTAASLVNGGDGWHAHPTQALLDAFTIRRHLGRVDGLRIAIVGDILHSRVARSNAWLLTTLGAQVVLCGPPPMLPPGMGGVAEDDLLPPVQVTTDLDAALRGADAVMALRIQLERMGTSEAPVSRAYARDYGLTVARLQELAPRALVLHPGPMNEGVEISPDVAHGAASLVEEQVQNGVAVRMAVLYLVTGKGA